MKQFKSWKKQGTKLRLMVTQTPINLDVYITDFKSEFSGGHGDIHYSINMIEAKDIVIMTVKEADAIKAAENIESVLGGLNQRDIFSTTGIVATTSSSSLWSIAEQQYGDGSMWTRILDNNSDKITDPDNIIPGSILKLS